MPGDGLATTRVGGVGALAVGVALAVFTGLPGAAAGVAVAIVWYALADLAAFALAAVAIGALVSPGSFVVSEDPLTIATVLPVGIAFLTTLPLLLGEPVHADRPIAVAGLTPVLAAGLGVVAMASVAVGNSVLAGATVLGAVAAGFAYGLHRYGMLVAGVIDGG